MYTVSPGTWRISAWRNSILAVGWPWTTECTLGDFNSNLVVPWLPHGEPRSSLCESPFSHFVCAALCSASVGTNSGDLPPTWPLPAQQVVLVGVRTKVDEGNWCRNGSYSLLYHVLLALFIVYWSVLYMCSST
ncbi:hypothetical protein E2C01_015366 [Portunus trituberculatus]|uniref:Uncharacterized protein n=1 Tax=Portunus trituberculatus TaxID=210409 RepID=A0A5B7DMU1_PORTR|nr:hypothetical protein [Portunus trituberculatus]